MDLTVAVAVAGPAATGTVDVTAGGTVLCSADLPAGGGSATCHIGNTAVGPGVQPLVASYRGDGNYNSAQSEASNLTVGGDPTTTVVTPSAATLSVSQEGSAQFSYSITPAASLPGVTPTGRISIFAGGPSGLFPICSQEISGTTGSCALTANGALPPGTYQVGAFYFGDGAFGSSHADEQTFTITADPPAAVPTGTTLALSAARATFGHESAERLSVQVSPQSGGGTPAGQVTVRAGSASVCTITLSGGNGSCALGDTSLRPGTYQLTASYAGSAGFQASASTPQALTVAAEPTTTSLALSAAKVKVGHEQAEHLSVQVKPQFSGTPGGKVTVKAGSVKVCVITLKRGKGICTLTSRQLRAGTYQLTAVYAGATPFAGSTSDRKTLTVTK